MGKRSEPRKPVQVQVRLFGTDAKGRIFSESATTVDVCRSGAKLSGIKAELKVDEIVGLSYGRNKVHFRVKWTGKRGTPLEGQIGLLNLTPDRPLWDFPLPASLVDAFKIEARGDRRQSIRVKCDVPVEIHPADSPTMWGKASDLSVGGCFVEMPIPLKPDSKFEIALWIDGSKLRLKGEVASSAPGFGIGVRFMDVSASSREILAHHVQTLSPHV
jgi:hypothetical protein